MAFYDYIVLDGLKYRTLAKQWKPQVNKPATARVTLQGEIEATFGVTNILKWQGIIIAPVTMATRPSNLIAIVLPFFLLPLWEKVARSHPLPQGEWVRALRERLDSF